MTTTTDTLATAEQALGIVALHGDECAAALLAELERLREIEAALDTDAAQGDPCVLCDNTRIVAATLSASPDTLADVVAFASLDPEAVDRAELLALEHVGTARPICWRFGAVDPETASAHGYRQEPGQAIAGLGFGFALAPRDTPLHPYKILVYPPL